MVSPLCANGCGFFGSATNQNLCSKCYKDLLKERIAKSEVEVSKAQKTDVKSLVDSASVRLFPWASQPPCAADVSPDNAVDASASADDSENVKIRCKNCNKKVGLKGFRCRCGFVFCGRHRYPEEHACQVDFKEIGRKGLVKQNPVCKGDKLQWRV